MTDDRTAARHRAPRRRTRSPFRALFVTHEAERTGAPIHLWRFLRWVREHTDLDVSICSLRDGPLVADFAALGPVRVVDLAESSSPASAEGRLDTLGFSGLATQLRHVRQLHGTLTLGRFDLLYLNSVLSAPLLTRLRSRPELVICHLHEMAAALRHAIRPVERDALIAATDWFITCSDHVTADAIATFGGPPVRRHYSFIDPLAPEPSESLELRARLGIRPDALVVGGAGSITWRKGSDLFAAVARTVIDRRPGLDVHFAWAGTPDLDPESLPLREDAARLGIGERFHLLGEYTSPAAVFGIFDVFCLTSREDPFPLVMLEAGSLGVPMVAFANGGVTELAGANDDPVHPLAEVVDYLDVGAMADSVIRLLDERDARVALGARLRDHVLGHHVSDLAAPALYEDLRRLVPALPPVLSRSASR